MKTQTTAIVRQRGQLTIPGSIRGVVGWLMPTSVVTITTEKPDEIIIHPHGAKQQIEWDELWNKIKLSRSFKGKQGNLAEFIFKDRGKH